MTLQQAIDELEPLTPRQLTARCKAEHIVGVKGDCNRCVLARLIVTLTHVTTCVDVIHGTWEAWTEDQTVTPVALPKTMCRFADAFDTGKYPQLEVGYGS